MKTGNVVVVLLLWSLAPLCGAQQVMIHACRDAHGLRVYQDAPCAGGLREVAVRTYAPPRDPPDAARRLEAIDRQVHAGWERDRWPDAGVPRRRIASGSVREDARDTARRQCRAARAAAARATRSRNFRGDRTVLEEAAVDACFAL